MSKLTTPSLASGYRSVEKITEFITDVGDALENMISRDGTGPNQMEAPLDMNGQRILNIAAPTQPTDLIRLQDISSDGSVVVAGGGPALWSEIIGKPTVFPPDTTTASNVSDFTEATQDVIGSAITAGTNISVAYNDTTGLTTVSAVSPPTASIEWVDVLHKPTTFTPASHTHAESEIVNLVSDLAGKAPTVHNHVGLNAANFVNDFDGDPAGSTAVNNAALAAAEASTSKTIWVPEGTFNITTNHRTLTKNYVGPGRFFRTNYYRRNINNLLTNPGYNTDPSNNPYGQNQLTSFSEVESVIINPSTARFRPSDQSAGEAKTRDYFGQQWTPHWLDITMEANAGYGGVTSHIPAGVAATATSCTLHSAAGLAIGNTVGFGPIQDDFRETRQITNIVGNVISWSGGLTNSYAVDTNPPNGETLGPVVSKGSRTWNSGYMVQLTSRAGGDNIAYGAILDAQCVPTAGQAHFFNTQTTGVLEGSITLSTEGNYGKITEFTVEEPTSATGGNGAITDVRTLIRNKAWAYGAVWGGSYVTATGAVPADFAYNVGGTFKRGFDTIRASFGAEAAAINLATGHRIYFNSSMSTLGHPTLKQGEGYYGNVIGNAWMGHEVVLVSTTLNGAISAAAVSAVLASTTGIGVGDRVRFVSGSIYEDRIVDSVVGTTINWTDGLTLAWVNGSTVEGYAGNLSLRNGTTILSVTPTSVTFNKATAVTGTFYSSGGLTVASGGANITGAVALTNSLTAVNLTASGNVTAAGMANSGAYNGAVINGSTITGSTLVSTGSITANSFVKTISTTFAGLPSAATAGAGARAHITDCNTATFGANAAGGGGSSMPVYSSGAVWIVG